jgi:hypothetical protein
MDGSGVFGSFRVDGSEDPSAHPDDGGGDVYELVDLE